MKPLQSLTPDEFLKFTSLSTSMTERETIPSRRNGLLCLLLAHTGIRIGEAVSMINDDVSIRGVPATAIRVRAEIAKTKTERLIPVNAELSAGIQRFLSVPQLCAMQRPTGWLFAGATTNGHLTTRQARRIVAEAGRHSIGRNIHPHLLRHTFASRLLAVSNTRIVQMVLGHKSLASTQIYMHPSANEITQAVEAAGTPNPSRERDLRD